MLPDFGTVKSWPSCKVETLKLSLAKTSARSTAVLRKSVKGDPMKTTHRGMASVEVILAIATGALVLLGTMQLANSSFLPKTNDTITKLLNSGLTSTDLNHDSTGGNGSTLDNDSNLGSNYDGDSASQGLGSGDGEQPNTDSADPPQPVSKKPNLTAEGKFIADLAGILDIPGAFQIGAIAELTDLIENVGENPGEAELRLLAKTAKLAVSELADRGLDSLLKLPVFKPVYPLVKVAAKISSSGIGDIVESYILYKTGVEESFWYKNTRYSFEPDTQ